MRPRLGLVVALINIVGVEFLINSGGLGQLSRTRHTKSDDKGREK
jgi:hypothetical protein